VLYTGGVAAYSYFQVKAIVEETLVERAKVDRYERADRVKQDILRRRRRAVSPSRARRVRRRGEPDAASPDPLVVPVVLLQRQAVLSMPLSYDKSFEMLAARYQ